MTKDTISSEKQSQTKDKATSAKVQSQICPLSLDIIDFSAKSVDYLIYVPQEKDKYSIYFIKSDELDSMKRCLRCPITRSPNDFTYIKLSYFSDEQREALLFDEFREKSDLEKFILNIIKKSNSTESFYGGSSANIEQVNEHRQRNQAVLPFYRALNPRSTNSGIFYSLAFGREYNYLEMKDHTVSYNFTRLYNALKNSNSLYLKSKLVCDLILGNHYDIFLTGNGSKGLLDYSIFPLIARRLIADNFKPDNKNFLRRVTILHITLPLEIARFSAATALISLSLPFVILAHYGKMLYDYLFPPINTVPNAAGRINYPTSEEQEIARDIGVRRVIGMSC